MIDPASPQLPTAASYRMTADQLRSHGHALIDWIADYLDQVEDFPVSSPAAPGWVTSQLPATPPEHPESFDDVMADVDRIIMPGVVHWQSPNFFGYFSSNNSGPSILGELLSAGLGVQGMLWATSPACTELETVVTDWMADLCGLPERFRSRTEGGGVIEDSASSSTLVALIAARQRARQRGVALDAMTVYASDQAHSSVQKGARIAGLTDDRIRLVPTQSDFSLDAAALASLIDEDRSAGLTPVFVCATVGTTSSGAFDDVAAVADIASAHDMWLHVDGAWAGSAAVCPENRWFLAGLERADSYVFNPHKWLLTNFDCSLLYVADRSAVIDALSIVPEYLRNEASEEQAVFDYRDWQIPLGRRFRALKLWFVIRHFGAEGLRAHIRHHVEITAELANRIADDHRFELAAPPALGLICFRHRAGDNTTRALLNGINGTGRALLSHTVLDDRFVIRVAVGARLTEKRHVDQLWTMIDERS